MKQTLNALLDILILALVVYFISKIFGLDLFKELFISNFTGYCVIQFVNLIKENIK